MPLETEILPRTAEAEKFDRNPETFFDNPARDKERSLEGAFLALLQPIQEHVPQANLKLWGSVLVRLVRIRATKAPLSPEKTARLSFTLTDERVRKMSKGEQASPWTRTIAVASLLFVSEAFGPLANENVGRLKSMLSLAAANDFRVDLYAALLDLHQAWGGPDSPPAGCQAFYWLCRILVAVDQPKEQVHVWQLYHANALRPPRTLNPGNVATSATESYFELLWAGLAQESLPQEKSGEDSCTHYLRERIVTEELQAVERIGDDLGLRWWERWLFWLPGGLPERMTLKGTLATFALIAAITCLGTGWWLHRRAAPTLDVFDKQQRRVQERLDINVP